MSKKMSKKPRIKADAVAHPVFGTREEANAAIEKIGRAQRNRQQIETEMNAELARVKSEFEAKAKPHAETIANLSKGVKLYCEARRAELTEGGKVKTHTFAAGDVSWRTTPPAVNIRSVEDVIARLEANDDYAVYLRQRVEINKETLLADREKLGSTIPGVSFSQREEFVIKPYETTIEEVQK